MPPKIITVVLNTNRRDDTLACLESLSASTYDNLQVMVLDNASSDGSVEAINARFPAVETVRLEHNLGYAGNNNVGIRRALAQGADWVFVLNEDTLVEPDCLSTLMAEAMSSPRVGVVGPMVYTFDPGQIISSAGGAIDWRIADAPNVGMGQVDSGQFPARQVDYINGCGLLISRTAIEAAGLIDDTFFIYFEETDWCARVRQAGFEIRFVPTARMRHKAPITASAFGPSTLYYMTRNRLRFFARHTPWWRWPLTLAHALNGAWRGYRQHRAAGRPQHARATAYAVWHALSRRWGKVDPNLWAPTAGDRTLGHVRQ